MRLGCAGAAAAAAVLFCDDFKHIHCSSGEPADAGCQCKASYDHYLPPPAQESGPHETCL